jgi:predicted nucleotidyltransferase
MTSIDVYTIQRVAEIFGDLIQEVVLVGGATVELLKTDSTAPPARATNDIDMIVEMTYPTGYVSFSKKLRDLKFSEDMTSGVSCRWVGHGLTIDVVPTEDQPNMPSNKWYSSAFKHSIRYQLPNESTIQIIDAPHFIATKLEAFLGRGKNDLFQSHDFEDIVRVFNSRPELLKEIECSNQVLREYLVTQLQLLSSRPDFKEAVEGQLTNSDDPNRVDIVLERIRSLF